MYKLSKTMCALSPRSTDGYLAGKGSKKMFSNQNSKVVHYKEDEKDRVVKDDVYVSILAIS